LEKIEMKKTLVAVAAMAAVTGAMADATIYGVIDQTYNTAKTTLSGSVISNKTGFGAYQMGQSLLGVKGSEDLGNGMKASYLYEFGLQTETTAAPTNRQSFVGLSGGFGSIRIGKQYSQAFNNSAAADPLGATGSPGALYLAAMTGYNGTEAPLRQDRGIQYDLPSFVPGLNVTLTKVLGNANSAPTNSSSTTETNNIKTGDGTGVAISYASGPFYAGYTTDTVTNTGINFGTNDDSIAQTSIAAAVPATSNTIVAASATNKNKINTTTLSYDLGMAKVSYNTGKMSVGSQYLSSNLFGVSIPMGAATLLASSSTGKVETTSTDYTLKGSQYGVNYAMSKRTTAYWHTGSLTASVVGSTVQKKVTGYGIGLMHAF